MWLKQSKYVQPEEREKIEFYFRVYEIDSVLIDAVRMIVDKIWVLCSFHRKNVNGKGKEKKITKKNLLIYVINIGHNGAK